MPLQLYAHPFSSYCQKVLTALYANGIEFEYRHLSPDSEPMATLATLWPMRRFPVLVDGDRTVIEATCILEHLDVHHPGRLRLLPEDRDAALQVRFMDRFFDNYVATPQQKIVFDRLRPRAAWDVHGVMEARAMLDTSYAWLDRHMDGRTWAAGDSPSLADCGAAPFLFYADWTHAIPATCTHVHAYRKRLLAWAPFARAVDEARPYRAFFPLGAPDRD